LLAAVAALLLVTASGVSAQTTSSTSSSSSSITLPGGTTITANPNTGEITVNLPKTDTTVNINTKDNNNATAKDNKTEKPLPKKPPAKPPVAGGRPAGGGGGGKGGSIVVTPNPDGSMTVTVTNGGETETITVNPEKDPQTGETTTTVTSPEDPKSNVSVTNDKDGNTTGTKAKTPNPTGRGGFVVESPGADGIGHIDYVDENGNITSGPTYNGDTQKVEIGADGIPHTVAKTEDEIKKDKEAKAAKAKKKTATGTEGSGTESGTATPPAETPPSGTSEPEQGQTPSPGSSSQTSWVNPAPTLVTDSFTGVVVDPAKPPATVTAYRTGNLSAGDSFSGTVTSDATDASQLAGLVYQVVEQDSTGKQTVVSQAPVLNGVYKGLIPAAGVAGGGVLIGELLKNGQEVGTATPAPIETQTAETSQPALTSDSYKIPSLMQAGKPTAIEFQGGDGDLTTTHVTVGGQPVQELAEGPNGTVFRSPTTVTGPTPVTISKNGVTGSGESRNVAIGMSAVSKSLQTGTQEELTVKVSGLAGLEKPLSLTLVNSTPAVMLQGGNTQTVTIAPSDVLADGTSTVERDITAEHKGTFTVTATVLTSPMIEPPLESTTDQGDSHISPMARIMEAPPSGTSTAPGGQGISENGGTKEDTKKKCDDCVAAYTTGPQDYDPGPSCAAASACKSTNKDLLAELANEKCHDDNTGNCVGDCGSGTSCGGIYDSKQSHGLSLDASVDAADSKKCKAKNMVTCDATLKIAAGGELTCRCSCSQK
jgi:hypothetical protein